MSQALKLPLANVRVIGHYMGGGFGCEARGGEVHRRRRTPREDDRAPRASSSSRARRVPRRREPPREHDEGEGRREEGRDADGDRVPSIGSGGAYPNGASTSFLATDLYTCPNVRTVDENVAINAGRARAMRAPGFPQGAWALEQAMDALALKLGMDPVELRLKNVPKVSQRRGNQPYTSTGLAECLRDGAKAFGWDEARKRPKGDGPIRKGRRRRVGPLGLRGGARRRRSS